MGDMKNYSTKPLSNLLGDIRRNNNFVVNIEGVTDNNNLELIIQKAFLPQVSLNVLELRHGNDALKFAGVATWAGGEITILDILNKDELDAVLAWVKQGYDWVDGAIGIAYGDNGYKKTGFIAEYAADGKYIRRWNIDGMWISKLDLGQLDATSGEMKEISFSIEIDPPRQFAPVYDDPDAEVDYGDGVSNDLNRPQKKVLETQ